jgi:hypothetical protein
MFLHLHFKSRPERNVDLMLSAIIREFEYAIRHGMSVDRHASDAATGARRVLDDEVIRARAVAVRDLVTGPAGRDAGVELEPSTTQTKTKDRF